MYSRSELYPEMDGKPMPVSLEELRDKGIEIVSEGVTLSPLRLIDAPLYFQLIEDDRDHLRQYGDETAEKYKTQEDVEKSITDPDNPFKLRFGIWDGDQMVGSINLEPIEDNLAEVGYWIGGRFTRQGYASRALSSMVDFAFADLGYEELEAHVEEHNIASQRTVVKNGFNPNGQQVRVSRPTTRGELKHYIFNVFTREKHQNSSI